MAKRSIYTRVADQVATYDEGSVICIADFSDIADQKNISKVLTKLAEKNHLTKLWNGIFFKKASFTTPVVPADAQFSDMEVKQAAEAIARSNGWHIVPSGQTALYYIGFHKNTPIDWTFITDGTTRSYTLGEKTISFSHASGRFVHSLSSETALWVQACKALTQKALNSKAVSKLKTLIKSETREKLLSELKAVPAWIRAAFLDICTIDKKKN